MRKIGSFFKKLFNFKKDGKIDSKKILLTLVIVAIIAGSIIFATATDGKNNQEKELTAQLTKLGKSFYEDFYYDQIGDDKAEREEVLSKFKTVGIKVSLDNLIRLNSDNSEDLKALFVNKKTGESCDINNTKVIIYPKDNYEKNDYKIETALVCGFESKNTDKTE